MKNISLDITKAACFLEAGAVKAFEPKVKAAQEALENGTCPGNDFLGWLHLPSSITPEFIDEVQAVANTLREKCEVVVVAGIGGSYLGARAVQDDKRWNDEEYKFFSIIIDVLSFHMERFLLLNVVKTSAMTQ